MKDPYLFEEVVLSSGARVFLRKLDYASQVAIGVRIGVGGRYGKRGLSHFLEHYLGKKNNMFTDSIYLGEYLRNFGGDLRTFFVCGTSIEFSGTISKGRENILAEAFSAMLLHPVFLKSDFEEERKVIFEEISRAVGSDKIMKELLRLHFCAFDEKYHELIWQLCSPLRNLGTEEDVKNITLDDIKAHYLKYFVPSNIIFFVVGNFKKERMTEILERYFKFPSTSVLEANLSQIEVLHPVIPIKRKSEMFLHEIVGSEENYVSQTSIEFKAIFDFKEYYTISVLQSILGKRIFEVMRIQESMIYIPTVNIHIEGNFVRLEVFLKTTGDIALIEERFIEILEEVINSREYFEVELKRIIAGCLTFNESSFNILQSAMSDFGFFHKVVSLRETEKIFKTLTFEEFREAGKKIQEALHVYIEHP